MATFDEFPRFSGWPSTKIYFLENMAWKKLDDKKHYVVVPDDEGNKMTYTCVLCKARFPLVFHQDEEEWVFDDCEIHEGVIYHYPLCYETGVELGLQTKS